MRTTSAPRQGQANPESRIPNPALVALLLSLAVLACARPRSIDQPVPGAVEITVTDSVRHVVAAAVLAIADEGVGIVLSDPERGVVESDWVDIGAIRTPVTLPVESYAGPERVVRFTIHVRATFGGSTASGAAVYQPARVGGRATERMVPAGHAGRAVLDRILEHIREYVDEARRAREERGPTVPPGR